MSPILVWGIVLAVAVVFEIATVALVSIWFAFGSLLALIARIIINRYYNLYISDNYIEQK